MMGTHNTSTPRYKAKLLASIVGLLINLSAPAAEAQTVYPDDATINGGTTDMGAFALAAPVMAGTSLPIHSVSQQLEASGKQMPGICRSTVDYCSLNPNTPSSTTPEATPEPPPSTPKPPTLSPSPSPKPEAKPPSIPHSDPDEISC